MIVFYGYPVCLPVQICCQYIARPAQSGAAAVFVVKFHKHLNWCRKKYLLKGIE